MISKRWIPRAVATLAVVAAVATACNSTAVLTQGPRLAKSQTLRVLIDDQPQTFDPGQVQYGFESSVLRVIVDPLLKPKDDLSGVVPAAAESYEVTNGGTQYVFHLRKDAQWWDGTPVKAQDFVYAWRRLIDPRLAAPTATFFAGVIQNGDRVAILDPQRDAAKIDPALQGLGLAAPDDLTFRVTLSHPDPAFVWLAAMPAAAPIREDVVKASGDRWSTSPDTLLTNGPFRVSYIGPDHITVVQNQHHAGPRAMLTSITFDIVKDGASALDQFKSGGLDVMAVQPPQVAAVSGDSQLAKQLTRTPSLTVYWMAFRVTSPRLRKTQVREAIAEAIDRNAFVRQVLEGQGQPAETFIPQGMHGYAPNLGQPQRFDAAQARALLAQAGVSPAQLSGVRLSFNSSSDFSKATAAFIRDQLKANLGVNVAMVALDPNTLGSRLESGDFDIAGPLGWSADYPDPADWFQIFQTSNSYNYSLYESPRYDALIDAAAVDTDPNRRDGEYSQAQKLLVNDAPVVFLAQNVGWYLVQPWVHGLTGSSLADWPGQISPENVYITEH
ncbi:MAG TPA: peptide ABC transporter substrate-binding protein [Candidatus Dormibacteraeota bacterium]|nr:peptide ABC transporter substrate-binding protein [Candidatus Dormibacteraeota bacterium]